MAARFVLILTALDFEARPIARRLGLRRQSATTYASGDGAVRLRVIGPLARHLPDRPDGGCRLVLLAGLAGGLAPDLTRGDLVVDEQSDPAWPVSLRRGRVETVAHVVATPAEKARLHAETGGLVADMESAAVRAWAARHGTPFLGLRAVSDAAGEPLDPATLRLVDDRGFLRISRVLAELARRPALLPTLWRMRASGQTVEALAEQVFRAVRADECAETPMVDL